MTVVRWRRQRLEYKQLPHGWLMALLTGSNWATWSRHSHWMGVSWVR